VFRYLVVWLLLFTVFVLFAGSLSPYTLLTGGLVAGLLSAAASNYLVSDDRKLMDVKRFLYLVYYFLKYITIIEFKAHMDVVKRIITGEVKPGIVKVPVDVKSKYARLLVANSITNTPGTVVVDEKDNYFYVNWINVTTFEPLEAKKAISEEFEEHASRIFD
jgi:multicomponent Na+:H+ antiporter subunit E